MFGTTKVPGTLHYPRQVVTDKGNLFILDDETILKLDPRLGKEPSIVIKKINFSPS